MTHALVTVMVEQGHHHSEEAINRRVAKLMAPHNEQLEVDPYGRPC